MKMGLVEKLFVNNAGHGSHVARQTERRLDAVDPRPGQRALDVGCGNGAAAIHVARTFGLSVVGVDVDPAQIRAASESGADVPEVRFQVADATSLPFGDGEFDLVYTSKTTHHIPDWPRALAEMARVLRPGGRLVYSDFAAPVGSRFPTRRGVEATTAANGLTCLSASGSPLHYGALFEKTAAARPMHTQVS